MKEFWFDSWILPRTSQLLDNAEYTMSLCLILAILSVGTRG